MTSTYDVVSSPVTTSDENEVKGRKSVCECDVAHASSVHSSNAYIDDLLGGQSSNSK